MEQPFPTPHAALLPVSPERANIQKTPLQSLHQHGLSWDAPSSPSQITKGGDILSSGNLPDRVRPHVRGGSDVLGKVAKFDGLTKDGERRVGEAALRRAMIGREEAETETKLLRDEVRRMRLLIETGKDRERRVGERLENVMEELHRTKSLDTSTISKYEKEVKRLTKENFKYSSRHVKQSEELKATREYLRTQSIALEDQKLKTERQEQDAFAAKYRLVGSEEEAEKLRERVSTVEQERDALKMSLKEEEVARVAAEGRIALPDSRDGELDGSPARGRFPVLAKEVRMPSPPEEEEEEEAEWTLAAQLEWERKQRQRAEETVEFMRAECSLNACLCQLNHAQPPRHAAHAAQGEATRQDMARQLHHQQQQQLANDVLRAESTVTFSSSTGTFHSFTPARGRTQPPKCPNTIHAMETRRGYPEDTSLLSLIAPTPAPSPPPAPHQHGKVREQPREPHRPQQQAEYRQISHTMRVPLASADDDSDTISPRVMSREEAIEAIRQRRGRARSTASGAMTPGRKMMEVERRDVSAPAGRPRGR